MADHIELPDWVERQRGSPYGRRGSEGGRPEGWRSKPQLVRDYVRHLEEADMKITHGALRELLRALDRDYSLSTSQVSKALSGFRRMEKADAYPNRSVLRIRGETYRGLRAAAEALGLSPQTVLNRINSKDQKWADWRRDAD